MKAKKSLGQHFLNHGPSIQHIVDAAGIGAKDLVVEIGPGHGVLTGLLLERAGRVIAIEIDDNLCGKLAERFAHVGHFQLIHRDVQQVDLATLVHESGCRRAILVGNLPYFITGILLRQITDARHAWLRAVIMVQREVAQRMVALPGCKDYGVLSAVIQVRCIPRRLFDLPPDAFSPPPKVHSSVLSLDFETPSPYHLENEAQFLQVVRTAFQQRRKMLHNTLRPLILQKGTDFQMVFEAAEVDGNLRPEAVSIEKFERICRVLSTCK